MTVKINKIKLEDLRLKSVDCGVYVVDDTPDIVPQYILTTYVEPDELQLAHEAITKTIAALGFTGDYSVLVLIGTDYYDLDHALEELAS